MPTIKPRHVPPLGHKGRVPTLVVRHPHYPNHNTLVKLPALDEGNTVDYDVALMICGIICDNSWSTGWFARSNDGSNVCGRGLPLTIDGAVYYFVKDKDYKYPVYISWEHWHLPQTETELPHAFSTLLIDPPPPSLRNGGYMEDLKGRDQSCRVSGTIDFSEQAHLVPAKEKEWWDNNMGESSDLEIESALNGILLRADLHRSFDSGTWVPMAGEEGRLFVYVVRTTEISNQFAALWHNVEMQQLVGVDRRCLFARVAWAVLSLHYEFLCGRRLAEDNLLVRLEGRELKDMAPDAFKQFSRSRSRNPSPTKRQRVQGLEEYCGIIVNAELRWDSPASDEKYDERSEKRQQTDDEKSVMSQRGRKRIRSVERVVTALNHYNVAITSQG